MQATLEDVRTESEEKYENLCQAYGELKLAWDNRGAREVDVERINQLTQMINERDEQIQGFEKKYSELRNVRAETATVDHISWDTECSSEICCRKCYCGRTTITTTLQTEALASKCLVWTELCPVGTMLQVGC